MSYIDDLLAQPCKCVTCPRCLGRGYVEDPMDYSGQGPDECPDCLGFGGDPVEVCDRCMEIEQYEYDEAYG